MTLYETVKKIILKRAYGDENHIVNDTFFFNDFLDRCSPSDLVGIISEALKRMEKENVS